MPAVHITQLSSITRAANQDSNASFGIRKYSFAL